MSRWLRAAVNAEKNIGTPVDTSTEGDKTQPQVETGVFCPLLSVCRKEVEKKISPAAESDIPLIDALEVAEERAAIAEFDGGLSRDEAERLALANHGRDILSAIGSGCNSPSVTFALLDRLIASGRIKRGRDGLLTVRGAI